MFESFCFAGACILFSVVTLAIALAWSSDVAPDWAEEKEDWYK